MSSPERAHLYRRAPAETMLGPAQRIPGFPSDAEHRALRVAKYQARRAEAFRHRSSILGKLEEKIDRLARLPEGPARLAAAAECLAELLDWSERLSALCWSVRGMAGLRAKVE
jgi:hypothetical protein